MKLVTIGLVVVAGSAAFAQSRGGHSSGIGGGRSFSGSRVGISRPIVVPPPVTHIQHNRGVIVPYPVYYGGYYYSGFYGGAYGDLSSAYTQNAAPAYDAGYSDAATGQSPVVVINQGFRGDQANALMRDYSDGQLPEPGPDYRAASDQPTIYLLAMTDHTILPAIAYWADGDTLSYITSEGVQNRISLSLIDREFSRQLNDSRGIEFKLPPARPGSGTP